MKRIQNSLYLLITYFDTTVPFFFAMHSIMTFLRIAQYIGPSFFAQEKLIFNDGSIGSYTIDVFSIIYQVIPNFAGKEAYIIIGYIYIIVMCLFYIGYSACAAYYQKNASLNSFLATLLSISLNTLCIYLQPVALNAAGYLLGSLFTSGSKDLVQTIVVSIVIIIIFLVYVWALVKILSNTIMFRPQSLQAIDVDTNLKQSIIPNVVAFLGGLSSGLPLYPKVAVMCIVAIIYGLSSYLFINACHTNRAHTVIIVACSSAGAVNSVLGIVGTLLHIFDSLIFFIAYAAIFVLSYIVTVYAHRSRIYKSLDFLDQFEEDHEIIVSPSKLMKIIVTGFQLSHGACLDFSIFEHGIKLFPDNIELPILYAKFVAIYPEINKTLVLVQQQLQNTGMRNGKAKQIIHQIISIVDTRESVLSPSLKKKINTAQKRMNHAKRKLLSIWDFVLQANINELDSAIEGAYQSTLTAEREVKRLNASFPNNMFVCRIYTRFLREIKVDLKAAAEQIDKSRFLRRGQLASVDRAHELGTHAFPNLPTMLEKMSTTDRGMVSMESFQNESDVFDDEISTTADAIITIKNTIENVTIPSVKKTILYALIVLVVLVLVPVIAFILANTLYVENISEPVNYIDQISMMRYMNFVVAANIYRIATEELTDTNGDSIGPSTDSDDFYPAGYYPNNIGGSRKIREQFKGLVPQIAEATGKVNSLRSYKESNAKVNEIRDLIFKPSIEYKYYKSHTEYDNISLSIINCLMDCAVQASLINQETFTAATLDKPQFLNPGQNCETVGNAISNALSLFTDVIQDENTNIKLIFTGIEIGFSILLAIVYFGMIAFIMITSNSEAREIYKAMTMLPKGTVSQAAEAQRMLKKNSEGSTTGTATEMNKQEENIIKVFASASDSTSGYLPMHIIQSISIVICLAVSIAAIIIMLELYKSQYQGLVENAPHADYLLGMTGYMYGALIALHSIALYNSGLKQATNDPLANIDEYDRRLNTFIEYFNMLRYGGSGDQEYPFVGFVAGLTKAKDIINCEEEERYLIQNTFPQLIKCYNAEYHLTLFSSMSRRLIEPYRNFKTADYDPNLANYELKCKNTWLANLWVLGPCLIYDTFVYPVHQTMISDIKKNLEMNLISAQESAIVCIVIAVLCSIVVIYEITEIGKRIQFTLLLFLHIDPIIITGTPRISQLINGNFRQTQQETSTRNSAFFEEVVDKLINAVITCNGEGHIISMNAACKKAFDINFEDWAGKPVQEFFTVERFGENSQDCLGHQPVLLQCGNEFYECQTIATKDSMIISLDNMTPRVIHSRLIAEEKAKSDMMLSSILPPAMVPRVQAGEANISFAVQSASVLFLDIVSFTPWCGANQAAYIMKVLNRLFKDLDARMKEYPTLTKIKCIGDCYMAAGGIFAEVNQPTAHATEMVQFGLDAIAIVQNINEDLGERLQIRVGVNTGGPLVAGVIGTGKPTFEILGPTINLAQQMEHHGVPMKVHISRAVYELIYGGNFNIKERGEVEVKQGKISTYVVSPSS